MPLWDYDEDPDDREWSEVRDSWWLEKRISDYEDFIREKEKTWHDSMKKVANREQGDTVKEEEYKPIALVEFEGLVYLVSISLIPSLKEMVYRKLIKMATGHIARDIWKMRIQTLNDLGGIFMRKNPKYLLPKGVEFRRGQVYLKQPGCQERVCVTGRSLEDAALNAYCVEQSL